MGAGKLFITQRMALLCITFFYTGNNENFFNGIYSLMRIFIIKTGLELSFFSGVYGTAIGNTIDLAEDGNAKRYIGISGMLIGAGEIIGGASFGILGSKTNRYGRDPIVILGYVVHMISFFLIFINLPSVSSLEPTHDPAYITSRSDILII